MRFPPQTPMPLDRATVEMIDEGQRGCYGLLEGKEIVFIGSGDIRERLLAHLNGEGLGERRPTHWIGVVTPRCEAVVAELLAEYSPPGNR